LSLARFCAVRLGVLQRTRIGAGVSASFDYRETPVKAANFTANPRAARPPEASGPPFSKPQV